MVAVSILTAFFACVIGKVCGMGGGVIIKPVLDALSVAGVSSINLLSGCTVLCMSAWSVGKSFLSGDRQIDLKVSTPLALGAAAGGVAGKAAFSAVAGLFESSDTAGGVQAVVLALATAATLLYTLRKDRIASRRVRRPVPCAAIGLSLGALGAFLGIGGGPFNMAVLFYFFSMPAKAAAQNSLYVILISQAAGLLLTLASGSLPSVSLPLLAGMAACGILGSECGSRVNKRLNDKSATRLFEGSMVLVMLLCAYNAARFLA